MLNYSIRSVGNYGSMVDIYPTNISGGSFLCVFVSHSEKDTHFKTGAISANSCSALSFLVDSKNCPQFKFASMNTK